LTETGTILNHLYGFPYIPGSAVKGVAHSFALSSLAAKLGIEPMPPEKYDELKKQKPPGKTPLEKFEAWLLEDDKDKRLALAAKLKDFLDNADITEESELFRKIFGTAGSSGKVLFFDALPLKAPALETDIMNVHYANYYKKGDPPADYSNPDVIKFLTVGKGTTFVFHLAASEEKLVDMARVWLGQAVTMTGVGAKTRAGYGEQTSVNVTCITTSAPMNNRISVISNSIPLIARPLPAF
jgi:CRISPR-associated protein Cmr6